MGTTHRSSTGASRMARPSSVAPAAAPKESEAEFQRWVMELADVLGWSTVHFRPAMTSKGYRTPVSGPLGKGWPDLVLVRERVIFAELKSDKGKLSLEQDYVLGELRNAGAEVYVWRPQDRDEIGEVLFGREQT